MQAVVHAPRTWRCYLEDYEFTVVTGHNHLLIFRTQQYLSRNMTSTRWSELIGAFTFDIQYEPGPINMADPLSWQPHGEALAGEATLMVMTP